MSKRSRKPVCTASQPSVTEEKSDKDIKVSFGCSSQVSGPVTTIAVYATIDMPEYRGVNMSGIDEFDSVISDQIVNDMEDVEEIVEDLGNLEMENSEEHRKLRYNEVDLKDDSMKPTNTEEVRKL